MLFKPILERSLSLAEIIPRIKMIGSQCRIPLLIGVKSLINLLHSLLLHIHTQKQVLDWGK
nr:MAG TPA: hypothetical protein [Caudoviricetes sp.]